jgi:ferredoxin
VVDLDRRAFITRLSKDRSGRSLSGESLASLAGDTAIAKAHIDEGHCIAWKNNICYTCQDRCTKSAIKSRTGTNPMIDANECTGCGDCVTACFMSAIKLSLDEMPA